MTRRCLHKELMDVPSDPLLYVIAAGPINGDDPFKWLETITGPASTLYEGVEFT